MNIICKVWGHDEVHDQEWPVSWCSRCNQTVSEYGHPNEELSESWNCGRPFWWLKNEIRWRSRRLYSRVKNWYMTRQHGEHWDIPF